MRNIFYFSHSAFRITVLRNIGHVYVAPMQALRSKTVDRSGISDLFILHPYAAYFGDYSGFSAITIETTVSPTRTTNTHHFNFGQNCSILVSHHPKTAIFQIVQICSNLLKFVKIC